MDLPILEQGRSAVKSDQYHLSHHANYPATANPSQILLRTHEQGYQEELTGVDAQVQGKPHSIVGITAGLDSGVRFGVL